jgi:aspartyl-tRNA(Asn)/glutamyl-tRNA(Gln) amidotransferase subunit A
VSSPWLELGAHGLAEAVRKGEVSALELCEAYLARLESSEPHVHAWRRVVADEARRKAEAIDLRRAAGAELGPLAGVPTGLKDIFVTKGLETDCGSKMLAGWVPPYQGTHARRLEDADAVLLGKLAMDEFAMGSSNENTPFEVVRNPWALDHVPGGSSGGSAAAVAARSCALSLGSDTGGSIRQPASMCGVSGLKPSYGRVSRHGMIAFASSLDQAGPFAREVEDLALALGVIAGADPKDATCADLEVDDYLGACGAGIEGVRIGIHRRALEHEGLDAGVRGVFERTLAELVEAGAQLVDIELPHFDLAIACYYVLCTAEAASNLARYDGLRYGSSQRRADLRESYEATRAAGFGDEVKRRIMLGTYVLRADSYEAYYGRAMKVRRLIAEDYAAAFASCDLIASPTSPVSGFRIGERTRDPLAMYLSDIFTIGVNLAGLPGMSLPAGFAASRGESPPQMPVGLQLIAPAFAEARLFAAGGAFQGRTQWHRQAPSGLMQAMKGEA